MIAALFYNPIDIPAAWSILLLLPLLLSVSIVYKTVRTRNLPKLPQQTLRVFLAMLLGMGLLCLTLWLLLTVFL